MLCGRKKKKICLPGSNKVVYGPFEEESDKKVWKCWICKLDFCKKKVANAKNKKVYQKMMSRFITENQIENFLEIHRVRRASRPHP